MFRNRFFEAGVDAKVSPRVAKGRQSVTEGDEKVSPSFFKLLIFLISAGKCQSESATGLEREEKRRKEETTATTAAEET
jgi:hypothetical protein